MQNRPCHPRRHNDGLLRHNDEVLRHNDEVLRRSAGVLPHNSDVLPHNDAVPGHNARFLPHNAGVPRHNETQLPHNDGARRHNDGVRAEIDGVDDRYAEAHGKVAQVRRKRALPRPHDAAPQAEAGCDGLKLSALRIQLRDASKRNPKQRRKAAPIGARPSPGAVSVECVLIRQSRRAAGEDARPPNWISPHRGAGL